MNEPILRDALLKQNGAMQAELKVLEDLVAGEHRRARRLTYWTIGVWAVWFAMITVSLLVPALSKANAPLTRNAVTQPVEQRAPDQAPSTSYRPAVSPIGILIGSVLLAMAIALPFVGIVLLILMIMARRSASFAQIRGSIAALDAKLRMLEMNKPA